MLGRKHKANQRSLTMRNGDRWRLYMSRGEAATIYPHNLMRFQSEFVEYLKASEVLSDDDTGLVSHAVRAWIKDAVVDMRKMIDLLCP
jgi:hypothetical protein